MQLIDELKARQANEPSYFQQHLLTEDLKRIENLISLAEVNDDSDAFVKEATMIGWTPNDLRTHELSETLNPFLVAFHTRTKMDEGSTKRDKLDASIVQLWQAFDNHRMERLIGCLSRVPAPTDASNG